MIFRLAPLALLLAASCASPSLVVPMHGEQDGKLRIIAFGAHPDDCEWAEGGTGAKWAALGHHVKFVSCTNGDIGHWGMAGGPLATRRAAEIKKCGEMVMERDKLFLDLSFF